MTQPNWVKKTEIILQRAFDDNRTMLFEYEMYAVLKALGFRIPVHTIVRTPDDVTTDTMRFFSSSKIVLKVITRRLNHKNTSGGVNIVYKDTEFVRYSADMMTSHFEKVGIPIEGILLVEWIEYSQSLGNEILLGFRESETFGTVISFSKGGDDADHFAGNFSSPNLIFPPIDRKWATALQQSTKIYSKYIDEHRLNFINHIVDAEMKFSRLAIQFSNYFQSSSPFAITAFEVNPFVFTPENHMIAIDGWASFVPKKPIPPHPVKPHRTLDPFFHPRTIAVVGVSASTPQKPANIIFTNLLNAGHTSVFGINRSGGSVTVDGQNHRLHEGFTTIRKKIDLAILCIPARAALPVIRQCADYGVKSIILIPGGFSEATGTDALETEIRNISLRTGMRIIGPNCLGIISTAKKHSPPLNTFFLSANKFKFPFHERGNVALISQSGALCITEVNLLRSAVVPSIIVSYGNQIDVDAVDLINYMNRVDAIDVIGLYSEGLRPGSGRAFFDAIARSCKTVVVYKAGRTVEGHRAVESHTASVAGEYNVAKAAIKQAGGIIAESIEEHVNFIKTFSLLHRRNVGGTAIGIIANAGYEKTYAADGLGTLTAAELTDVTRKKLAEIIPSFTTVDSFLDLTPMATDDQYIAAIEVMLAAREFHGLCISIVPQAEVIHTTDEELSLKKSNLASRMVNIVNKFDKPVVASVNTIPDLHVPYNRLIEILDSGGIPTFITAGQAMKSLNEFIHHRMITQKNILSEWLK